MFASKHHPNGGATIHCDNSAIEAAITQYQTSRDLESLSQVVDLTQRRADTLIRFYRTGRYKPHDELLSDVNFKMMRAIDKFDPSKGSAFTFVSQVISNVLFTSVTSRRRDLARHRRLIASDLNHLVTNGETESQYSVEDMSYRVRANAKTTIENSIERDVQRWLVDSFCADGFEHRRCECADAAMAVHGVNYERSRELYDLTMLEVRRVLLGDLPPRQPIIAHCLHGTRLAWLARYAQLMSQDEFTKFVTLMRNLSPFVLFLIDPQNHSRRQDRCPAISRRNIEYILNGHPDARPLFE
jgi:DNA-directed RNA polymerase specialized sigma24 family protein